MPGRKDMQGRQTKMQAAAHPQKCTSIVGKGTALKTFASSAHVRRPSPLTSPSACKSAIPKRCFSLAARSFARTASADRRGGAGDVAAGSGSCTSPSKSPRTSSSKPGTRPRESEAANARGASFGSSEAASGLAQGNVGILSRNENHAQVKR